MIFFYAVNSIIVAYYFVKNSQKMRV